MNKEKLVNAVYYTVKPLLPRWFQLWMRRKVALSKLPAYKDVWPILEKAGSKPEGFNGWPNNKDFCVVLTHDVELKGGHDKVKTLIEIEKSLGFVSSYNFVPERYEVSPQLREYVEKEGFEVGVHGLNHDGKLFQNKSIFDQRAPKINKYIQEWNVVGFRSPAMHHDLDWIHDLHLEYDLSTFDTDPFEPQADGVETIFPFWVEKNGSGYVELPYTLAQDFTPYILMRFPDIDIWKKKVDWIVEKGGMVLVNVHPDYIAFEGEKADIQQFPIQMYKDLLEYISTKYAGKYWHGLPKEVARFWKTSMVD